ncbi:hypothetical protein BYT27DRAFT_7123256 [Phlegmacium glaucopus]|nr:hypothetical protein BYT27DRAFT_7123256 [Phlegmacium glaucopus]
MRILNKSLGPKTSGGNGDRVSSLQYAEVACFQLARVKRQSIKAKLGLKHSAQILLEIIGAAESSKFYRAACVYVANQAFHLLNAVDGGVQGQAIDVNNILRDYIIRLNQDFLSIHKILMGFTSWWSFSRFWSASGEIKRCHDLVGYGMSMYLLLLRCSLARGDQRDALRWQYTVAQSLGRNPTLNHSIIEIQHHSLQKSRARSQPDVHQTSGHKRITPHYRQQVRRS